jgi:hypothetical protein
VSDNVQRIIEVGSKMELALNTSKCELICHVDLETFDPLLSSFKRVDIAEATLLGASLFAGKALDEVWSARCADLARRIDRLRLVGAQDALMLLRSSFSALTVQHLLCCSLSVDAPGLLEFDELLKSAMSLIAKSKLLDLQWLQASLPIKLGGLGVRRVALLAFPAFLASAASTQLLQDQILAFSPGLGVSVTETSASRWEVVHSPTPNGALTAKQSSWDRPGLILDMATVEAARSSPVQ